MKLLFISFLLNFLCLKTAETSRILAVIPTASISHQIIFRPLTQALAKRGHEVVVITTDPVFSPENAPKNFREIDVGKAVYKAKKFQFSETAKGNTNDIYVQVQKFFRLFVSLFEVLMKTKEVENLLSDTSQHFDLIIIEACVRPALIFSHIYKAPVILVSSVGAFSTLSEFMGASVHPLVYPNIFHQKLYNLTLLDKVKELYKHYAFNKIVRGQQEEDNSMLRRIFGDDVPTVSEMARAVQMLFVGTYQIWDNNRPVPPNYLYIGGIHADSEKKALPRHLESYLNSSKNGVIYMSFGTNINPSTFPPKIIQTFFYVFSKLAFDVILKWDKEVLPGCPKNVKIYKSVPQIDLLNKVILKCMENDGTLNSKMLSGFGIDKIPVNILNSILSLRDYKRGHPKIKLFITQGGQQSTDEAISAGVPLVGIPMVADQWFNVEKYVKHKIGVRIDFEMLTEERFLNAIKTVTEDKSYRRNIEKLRDLVNDQPETPLNRAVWWTEHVLRHGGARHLRAEAANMSWAEYLELELVATVLLVVFFGVIFLFWCLRIILKIFKDIKIKFKQA